LLGRGRPDRHRPHGYFIVTADVENGQLIAEHRYGSVVVKRYQGTRAEDVEQQVSKDMAISLVSHAMWLGRELARKEQILKSRVKDDEGAEPRH